MLNVDFKPKNLKKAQKYSFLNLLFFESGRYVLAYNSGYDKYFCITLLKGLQKEIQHILGSRIFKLGFQNFFA